MRLYENSNLCEILKNIRLKCKISQEQLAEKIGCSRSTVSRIENGQDQPTYRIFYRWITACDKQLILRSSKTTVTQIELD